MKKIVTSLSITRGASHVLLSSPFDTLLIYSLQLLPRSLFNFIVAVHQSFIINITNDFILFDIFIQRSECAKKNGLDCGQNPLGSLNGALISPRKSGKLPLEYIL